MQKNNNFRLELNGYVVVQLIDGRYLASNEVLNTSFIVDELEEAMDVISAE